MTQYMLSVWHDDESTYDMDVNSPDIQRLFTQVDAFNAEVQAAGRWVFGGGLEPADIATVVRAEGGEVVTSDGPFVEAKEHIGGFWVLKAEDLDEALALAAKASAACKNAVEVRPFQDEPED